VTPPRARTSSPVLSSPPDCQHPPGRFAPVIDPNRCEGKSACVAERPVDVFVVRRRERAELPMRHLLGTRTWRVQGGQQAEAVRADPSQGCGPCVSASPEGAITLKRA
jgi:NAD-dependent dihydropyrimidine dehydrogenase PreA subunit